MEQVTSVELFFDLVYAFAITQLSHHLLVHQTLEGVFETGLLLAMVWLVWVYTTWVTNYLDPNRLPVRALLLGLMLLSLVMTASLPGAFAGRGLAVGAAYAAMQIGRSLFALGALQRHPLRASFQRILVWWARSAWTCSVAPSASMCRALAGRRPTNGPLRGVCLPSAAKPFCSSPLASQSS
jgi:low temperature requirement protein LtrA